MKNYMVLMVVMALMVGFVGCSTTQEGVVLHGNRILIETFDSPVTVLEQGKDVPINTVKTIKGEPIVVKGEVYFEVHVSTEDGFKLASAGRVTNGVLRVIEVPLKVEKTLVYLYLFKEGLDVWTQRYTLKATTAEAVVPPATEPTKISAPAPAKDPSVSITDNKDATGGHTLMAVIDNLPSEVSATFQWVELDPTSGTETLIAGATSEKYVSGAPGMGGAKFKVRVTIGGKMYEKEVVINP